METLKTILTAALSATVIAASLTASAQVRNTDQDTGPGSFFSYKSGVVSAPAVKADVARAILDRVERMLPAVAAARKPVTAGGE